MIGVITSNSERQAALEFFELFKTPWEFYDAQHIYDLLIITTEEIPSVLNAGAVAIFNSRSMRCDAEIGVASKAKRTGERLDWDGIEFPLNGGILVFHPTGRPLIRTRGASEVVGLEVDGSPQKTIRIGYDLFQEVIFLLSKGQPQEDAHIPTLEIHIAVLRSLLRTAGIPLVEVPPVPPGYDFMACLTHDVDFVGIRDHKFDHTLYGFLYRASAGSLIDSLRGRMTWSKCLQNWTAVLSLPLVYLGLKKDFWLEFDRYMNIERGLGSTFFFIPYRDYPGTLDSMPAPKRRAAKYDVMEIKEQLQQLTERGCEVGLHGIDAWKDSHQAQVELSKICEATGHSINGVRMHWLYFAEGTPKALEEAGISYDSTLGYNDAVGFRAGTAQAFSPVGVKHLLELPLIIQDTALFYPGRMNLSEADAQDACQQLIEITARCGGVLTVNWHTRSLSPERLWGDFYAQLLKQIQGKRVWFGTAGDIVMWFRERRSIRFEQVQRADGWYLNVTAPNRDADRPFLLRVHHPQSAEAISPRKVSPPSYTDIVWKGETQLRIANRTELVRDAT